jgi:hypothetical protein
VRRRIFMCLHMRDTEESLPLMLVSWLNQGVSSPLFVDATGSPTG